MIEFLFALNKLIGLSTNFHSSWMWIRYYFYRRVQTVVTEVMELSSFLALSVIANSSFYFCCFLEATKTKRNPRLDSAGLALYYLLIRVSLAMLFPVFADLIIFFPDSGFGKSWCGNVLMMAGYNIYGVFESEDIIKYGCMMIKRPPTSTKVRIKVR